MAENDVAERNEKAGYPVKDHGHRFFRRKVAVDFETGELYLPEGFKFVAFLWDSPIDSGVWVILKDEVPGG